MSRTKLVTAFAALFALVALLAGGFPLLGHLSPGLASDKEQKAKPEPGVRFSFSLLEPFDGKLRLAWKPIRPEPKAVSLTKNKGKLTIAAQRGSIHADEVARNDPKAKNLYVIDNPLADDTDFEVSVCLSNFVPDQQYQQAALICYDDDDNYIKWTYEFDYGKGMGTVLRLVRETAAKTQHDSADTPDSKTVWLRLTRRGDDYEYASSSDGKKWTVHGEKPWGSKGPAKIGILAKLGGDTKSADVDVCFSEFRLRAPAPPKAK